MTPFLIVNPQSGNGQTGRRWPAIEQEVRRVLGRFGHAFTEGPMHAATLAKEALGRGFNTFVSVGGDGTLNEVVNGLMGTGRAHTEGVCVGVLSRGTGGDFRRTFGWNLDLGTALERIAAKRTRPLDVGQVEFRDAHGASSVRSFVNVCSLGVSGQVDHEVNRSSKALGGKVSFLLGATRAFLRYADLPVELTLDDGSAPSVRGPVTCIAVGNGQYFGGGMKVAPSADPSDGIFDVTVWRGFSLKDFVFKAPTLYDGSHILLEGTQTFRCRKLRVTADQSSRPLLLDVDGEQPGTAPCEVTMVPGALKLLC